MLAETRTGSIDHKDIQIQIPCKSILIVTTVNALTNNVNVTLRKIGRSGTETLYDSYPILDLMEAVALDEGGYIRDSLASAVGYPYILPVAGARTVGMIPVTKGIGCHDLKDNDYFSLDINGGIAGTVYNIYAIEDLDVEEELVFIDRGAVPAPKTVQEYDTSDTELLSLPVTNLVRVELTKIVDVVENGVTIKKARNISIESAELIGLAMLENDIATLVGRNVATTPAVNFMDVVIGAQNVVNLNIEGTSKFKIYCSGAAGYQFYRWSYNKPQA